MSRTRRCELSRVLGKTITSIQAEVGGDVQFCTSDGARYALHHEQNCCESVSIESIVGDINDLVGAPLLVAEESTGETPADYKFEYEPESYTWTFYKFATRKGYVDIRFLGESSGYYSEGVDFVEIQG